MHRPAAAERSPIGKAGHGPERQLDHVVIELRGREREVVHAVDDQDRDQRADRADQLPRHHPDQRECRQDGQLRQRVKEQIGSEHPVVASSIHHGNGGSLS